MKNGNTGKCDYIIISESEVAQSCPTLCEITPKSHWRNNPRKNEAMEPKQKQRPAVDGTGDRRKVR